MTQVAERTSPAKRVSYHYEAVNERGRRTKGSVSATSEIAAQNVLADRGLTEIALKPIASTFSLEGAIPSMFGVKPVQIVAFSRQLATLLTAGVSLLPALQLLAQQRENAAPLRRILTHITSDLSMGTTMAHALSKHPQAFNEVYRRSIDVGERTGRLEDVLRDLAEHMEKQAAFAKKVSGAMTYPTIIMVVGIIVVIILLVVVLPPLSDLFTAFDAELPAPTRIMMAISDGFINYALYIFGGAGLLTVAIIAYLRTDGGQKAKDRIIMRIPLTGAPVLMGEIARLGRTMSLMLSAGLSLQEVMELMPQTTTNSVFREALEQVKRRLFLGQGLAYPMAANPLFPPLMLQMVRVGEESNTLDSTMRVVADFFEEQAEQRTAALVAMITPVSTIILAGMVGFVALSVIMPMYSLTGNF
ncbi:MAG: type II secretion system F family protein [Chloroflexi bacterium]|nr:type II secretion system F family protein [Chloroflexota bacterium]